MLLGGLAHVSAVGSDKRMARLLDVREGDALLRLEQVERSASEEAVLYSLEHFVPA